MSLLPFAHRRRLRALLAIAAFACPRAASAGVSYDAPEGADCPPKREIDARLDQASFAIQVRPSSTGFHGEIAIGDGRDRREVDGLSCRAVVDALVLIGTLVHDEPIEEPKPEAERAPISDVVAVAMPATEPRAKEAPLTPAPSASTFDRIVTLALADTSFADGHTLPNGSLAIELASRRSVVAGLSWLAPSLRMSGSLPLPFGSRTQGAPAFTLWSADAEVCPVRVELHPRASLAPCGRLTIGSLTAEAWGDSDPRSRDSRLWLTAGAIARARLFVGALGHGLRPVLEVSGGALAPAIRDRFHFPERAPIETPPVVWTIALAGGVAWD